MVSNFSGSQKRFCFIYLLFFGKKIMVEKINTKFEIQAWARRRLSMSEPLSKVEKEMTGERNDYMAHSTDTFTIIFVLEFEGWKWWIKMKK